MWRFESEHGRGMRESDSRQSHIVAQCIVVHGEEGDHQDGRRHCGLHRWIHVIFT